MRCKNCGFENEDSRYICSNCGSPLFDENEIAENDTDTTDDYNNNETDDDSNDNNSDDNKKQIIIIVIAVIVVIAVAAGIIFGAVSGKKNKETTTESTTVSTTAEETTKKKVTTTKQETTTKETTTEEPTTKETTTKPTTTTEKSFHVYVDIDGNGNVTGDGEYTQGKRAVLTAVPDTGYEFDGWYDNKGELAASGTKYTITVKEDITLTAKFKPIDGGNE